MTTLDEALRALEKAAGKAFEFAWDCEVVPTSVVRALLTTRQEVAPVAWMIPMIVSFKNAVRTSCPADLQDEIEGTVAWDAKVGQWCDCGPVVDKHGVEHHPTPLYTSTGQTSDARDGE